MTTVSRPREEFECEPWPPRHWLAADATQHIHSIDELRPGRPVVLVARCSGWEQERGGNLAAQTDNLLRVAHERGLIPVRFDDGAEVLRDVWSGNDPIWLTRAVELARRAGAVVVAESVCRLIRSPLFDPLAGPDDPFARPSWQDLDRLLAVTEDVELYTAVSPGATPAQIRGYQSRRGQLGKGSFGGRPPKQERGWKWRRREELRPEAIRLHAAGLGYGTIADRLGLSRSTVQGWLAAAVAELVGSDESGAGSGNGGVRGGTGRVGQ